MVEERGVRIMNKILLTASIVMSLLLLAACASVNATDGEDGLTITTISHDWLVYRTTNDLIETATDIVRVEFLDEQVKLLNCCAPLSPEEVESLLGYNYEWAHIRRYFVHTISRAKVIEVFKGDTQLGDIIEINQMGGQLGNEMFICNDRVIFEQGDDFIVFLNSWGAMGHERENAYSLLGPLQSIYRMPSHNGGIAAFSLNEELESINDDERFHLPLTMNDLLQVAESNFGAGSLQSFSVELDADLDYEESLEYLEESDEEEEQ